MGDLINVVNRNDLNLFRDALKSTVPLDLLYRETDGDGNNFLHHIAKKKNFDAFKILRTFLIEQKKTPGIMEKLCSQQNAQGETPIHILVKNCISDYSIGSDCREYFEIIEWIISRHPYIANLKTSNNKSIFDLLELYPGENPLREHSRRWKSLAQESIGRAVRNQTGYDPEPDWSSELFKFLENHSCVHESFKICMIEAKRQNDNSVERIQNEEGDNLWIYAIKHNRQDLVSWLLENAPEGAKEMNKEHNNILHLCVGYDRFELLEFLVSQRAFQPLFAELINQFNDYGQTPICLAAAEIKDSMLLNKYIDLFLKLKVNNQPVCNINAFRENYKCLFDLIIENHSPGTLVLLMDSGLKIPISDYKAALIKLSDYRVILQKRHSLLPSDWEAFENILKNYKYQMLASILHDQILGHPSNVILYFDDLKKHLSEEDIKEVLNCQVNGFSALHLVIQQKQVESAKNFINHGASFYLVSLRTDKAAEVMAGEYLKARDVTALKDLADKYSLKNLRSPRPPVQNMPLPSTIRPKRPSKNDVVINNQTRDENSQSAQQMADYLAEKRKKEIANKAALQGIAIGMTIRVLDGVLNGLPATKVTKRFAGLSHGLRLDLTNPDLDIQKLTSLVASNLIDVWGNDPKALDVIDAIVVAKLCELFRRCEPPVIEYAKGKISVNHRNWSFKSELEALAKQYANKKPIQLYTIYDNSNFDANNEKRALLDQIIQNIFHELFPSEIRLHLGSKKHNEVAFNKNDSIRLRDFLWTRFCASQVCSILFSDEIRVPQNGEYFQTFQIKLITEIAELLKKSELNLFQKKNNEWRLSSFYRKNRSELHDHKVLIRKIDETINKIENEMYLKANPDAVFQKICQEAEQQINHLIVAKMMQILSFNHSIDENKTIADMHKTNQEMLLHSRYYLDNLDQYKNFMCFAALIALIEKIKEFVKESYKTSGLPSDYYSKFNSVVKNVLDGSSDLNKVIQDASVAKAFRVNVFVLFEMLVKYFSEGQRINYDHSTFTLTMCFCPGYDLGAVHKKYSYDGNPGYKIGPNIEKWFDDICQDFNDYFGLQLNEEELIEGSLYLDTRYANFGKYRAPSPLSSSHGAPSQSELSSSNCSRYSSASGSSLSSYSDHSNPTTPRQSSSPLNSDYDASPNIRNSSSFMFFGAATKAATEPGFSRTRPSTSPASDSLPMPPAGSPRTSQVGVGRARANVTASPSPYVSKPVNKPAPQQGVRLPGMNSVPMMSAPPFLSLPKQPGIKNPSFRP